MIFNRQAVVRVPTPPLERFLARVRRKLRIPAGAVTVCFVTNAQMARWNEAFRRKRGPTDVLSFPIDGASVNERRPAATKRSRQRKRASTNAFFSADLVSPGSDASYLGDIAIAPAVARVNARRLGRTVATELRILILHGVIHLLGYDHETDNGEMDRFEQSLRRSLGL